MSSGLCLPRKMKPAVNVSARRWNCSRLERVSRKSEFLHFAFGLGEGGLCGSPTCRLCRERPADHGEFQGVLQRVAIQIAVDEACVEAVARASGINHLNGDSTLPCGLSF